MAISLEDLLGVIDQPNIPGTDRRAPELAAAAAGRARQIASAIDLEALEGRDPGTLAGRGALTRRG